MKERIGQIHDQRPLNLYSGPHVLIDGVDLTGKDTVGDAIASTYRYTNIQRLALVENNPFEANPLPEGHPLTGAHVVRTILFDIEHFRPDKPQLQVSSHALRGVAFSSAFDCSLAPVFVELLKWVPRFDKAIVLHASIEAKQKRLLGRSHKSSDLDRLVFTNPQKVDALADAMSYYAALYFGAEILNTTTYTRDEMVLKAAQILDSQNLCSSSTGFRTGYSDIGREKEYFLKELNAYELFLRRHHKLPNGEE
jgi:hypothetical protein